jgi:hypothetical protein|tara:strand:- start:476 stop:634 length:159 start_codon:yes stop_codon:yes gene_type:complete
MKDKDDSQTIDWVDDTQKQVPVAPATTSPELEIVLNHITNVTLQDLLAEYKD